MTWRDNAASKAGSSAPDSTYSQQDQQILILYAHGNLPLAFAALAELYRPLIRRSLERRLRDYHSWSALDVDADDLAHDVLLRLHDSLSRHPDPKAIERPRVWVWNSVTWTLESSLRRSARRGKWEKLAPMGEDGDTSPPVPEDPPDTVLEAAGLRKCVEVLAERPREVIRLWSLGVTLKSIAERLGYADLTGVDRVRKKAFDVLRRCLQGDSSHSFAPGLDMQEVGR